MLDFIKKYVFFIVDKNTKAKIKSKAFFTDLRAYRICILAIALYQFGTFIFNCANYISTSDKEYFNRFMLNISFSVACFIIYMILRYIKNLKPMLGFMIIHTLMVIVIAWGITKSIFDCMTYPMITVYAYVALTMVSFVSIEPWILILDLIASTLTLDLCCYFIPGVQFSTDIVVNSLAILFLGIMIAIMGFYRRNKSLMLECEVNELNDELHKKAYFDDLTGLHNRRFLSENMNNPLTIGENRTGIIMIDIDDFKKINDKYGHLSGDVALKDVGQIIREQSNATYIVRYGGEEFLIYYQETNKDKLFESAEAIRNAVENKIISMVDGTQKHITISLGITLALEGVSYNQMIDEADEALYNAKKSGKNKTCIYKE